MSEELSFYRKLSNIIAELKASKGQYNSFGKYKYRSAEDILEAVKPLINKYGLYAKLSDEILLIGDRYYVQATATITDGVHEEKAMGLAREPLSKKGMDESQITGTASSYARKYALNGLYQIDDTKDSDTDEHRQEKTARNNAYSQMIDETKVAVIDSKIKNLVELIGTKVDNQPTVTGFVKTITEKVAGKHKKISELTVTEFKEAVKLIDTWNEKYEKMEDKQ